MGKKTASIIGIVLGIAIIIIGISVMNPETILLGKRDSLGSLLGQYGADFYTPSNRGLLLHYKTTYTTIN